MVGVPRSKLIEADKHVPFSELAVVYLRGAEATARLDQIADEAWLTAAPIPVPIILLDCGGVRKPKVSLHGVRLAWNLPKAPTNALPSRIIDQARQLAEFICQIQSPCDQIHAKKGPA